MGARKLNEVSNVYIIFIYFKKNHGNIIMLKGNKTQNRKEYIGW